MPIAPPDRISPPSEPSLIPLKHSEYDGKANRLRAISEPIDMLVENNYRDNVGYVVEERWNKEKACAERSAVGTTFIVGWLLGDIVTHYAVTCLHVINPSGGTRGKKLPLFVRLNKALDESGKSTKYNDVPTPYDSWVQSSNSDVAVFRIGLDPSLVRYWAYPLAEMLGWGRMRPTIGDDVFMSGLFVEHQAQKSVEVLVRHGKIAREDADTDVCVNLFKKQFRRINSHLIQSLAWGGESGSPVFAYRAKQSIEQYDLPYPFAPSRPTVAMTYKPELIGMIHGHFPIDYGGVTTNSGIAIVIPVEHIYEALMDPRLVEDRERVAEEKRQSIPRPIPLSEQSD